MQMTKGLRNIPQEKRTEVAARRLVNNTRGNGFWAAKDYFDKRGIRYPAQAAIAKVKRYA